MKREPGNPIPGKQKDRTRGCKKRESRREHVGQQYPICCSLRTFNITGIVPFVFGDKG
jgi:hypothetical protein